MQPETRGGRGRDDPTADGQASVVRLFGNRDSAEAWAIRDFLKRSVVEFDWIELTGDEDCRRELGLASLTDVSLPVVQLPGGERLFGPSLREVAARLGFVAEPRLREYDLSIYGAGPAGLSAAVYAASEGLRTVLVERSAVGGQAGTTSLIENYMGFPDGINGADLAERARQQAAILSMAATSQWSARRRAAQHKEYSLSSIAMSMQNGIVSARSVAARQRPLPARVRTDLQEKAERKAPGGGLGRARSPNDDAPSQFTPGVSCYPRRETSLLSRANGAQMLATRRVSSAFADIPSRRGVRRKAERPIRTFPEFARRPRS